MATNYGYSRQPAQGSSIGGISAVNPQAKTDFQGYVDQAYGAAKSRLDPIFSQQNDAFQQSMINRGIPVGGEAYNETFQQLGQNQSDAYTQAANSAIGVGLAAQGQDFGQDATRSQLANALLQSKWSADLGWGNNALGYAGLNENSRQFDNSLTQRGYEFDTSMGEGARQFDASQDFGYWDKGNYYGYLGDRASMSDLQWLTNFERGTVNDQNALNQWSDGLGQQMLQPFNPNLPNVGNAFIMGNQANQNLFGQQYGNYTDWWGNFGDFWGGIAKQAGE